MESYQFIRYEEVQEHIGLITINQPERFNALPERGTEEFLTCLAKRENDLDCRVLIVTGEGTAFCAGADIKEQNAKRLEKKELYDHIQWFYRFQKKNG